MTHLGLVHVLNIRMDRDGSINYNILFNKYESLLHTRNFFLTGQTDYIKTPCLGKHGNFNEVIFIINNKY